MPLSDEEYDLSRTNVHCITYNFILFVTSWRDDSFVLLMRIKLVLYFIIFFFRMLCYLCFFLARKKILFLFHVWLKYFTFKNILKHSLYLPNIYKSKKNDTKFDKWAEKFASIDFLKFILLQCLFFIPKVTFSLYRTRAFPWK